MGRVTVTIPHAALGFDSDQRWTRAQYAAMRLLGFRFAIRYLGDLTSDEVDDAHAADIGIVPVAHAHLPGWMPSAQLGADDGRRVVHDLTIAGLPPCEVWADLEGVALTATRELVQAYSVAWCAPVHATSNDASVYVGAQVPADPHSLYALPFTGYWQSESDVPTPWRRGYKLIQLFAAPKGECLVRDVYPDAPPIVAHMAIDADVTRSDYLGGRCRMVVSAAAAAA